MRSVTLAISIQFAGGLKSYACCKTGTRLTAYVQKWRHMIHCKAGDIIFCKYFGKVSHVDAIK